MEINELLDLIDIGQEGSYWDYKREWYNAKDDLLHDIICMANNLVNREAYIIIGIDESNDFSMVNVKEDSNRKNTQKLVDFLKDKKFAGDIRPIVKVESFEFPEGTMDVIIIKSDNNTPYFLRERYKGVEANYIYTRIQDTNTPKNSSADIDKVEYLWKKRFGLLETPLDKIEIYLTQPENWSNGPYGEMRKYYKLFPEYTINYDFAEDGRNGYEYYLFSQCDHNPNWMDIKIYYHQTLLMNIGGVSLDGGRYFTPCPLTDGIKFEGHLGWGISYKYMVKNSFIYKLNEFFYHQEWSDEARISRNRFFEAILLFEDETERTYFNYFVANNWKKREEYKGEIHVPYIPKIDGYRDGYFTQEYENALILGKMLDDYKKSLRKK